MLVPSLGMRLGFGDVTRGDRGEASGGHSLRTRSGCFSFPTRGGQTDKGVSPSPNRVQDVAGQHYAVTG